MANGETLAALAVTRSLGRAGYRVVVSSTAADAPAFRSRYCTAREQQPRPGIAGVPEWLRRQIARHDVGLVIPSESLYLDIRSRHAEFSRYLALPHRADVAERGFSKYELFERSPRENTPPTLLVRRATYDAASLREWAGSVAPPYFVKVDALAADDGAARVLSFRSDEDLVRGVEGELRRAERLVAQAFVPGHGFACCLLRLGGEVRASLVFERLHEVPHTGGPSSLRRTVAWDALEADATRRLAALDWTGAAMVEYRGDQLTGRFALMEVNARFWGSLHLALHAGVDFPRLLADHFFGYASAGGAVVRARPGTIARVAVPGEIQHIASIVRSPDFGAAFKVRRVALAAWQTIDPRVRSDLLAYGDVAPAFRTTINYGRVLLDAGLRRVRARYGRLRGVLPDAAARAALRLGALRSLAAPLPGPVHRLVFVCAGNICRSAFAEAYARALGVPAVSCGLHADDGTPAWAPVTAVAAQLGIDMGGHASRRLSPEEFRPGDLVLAFEVGHARQLASLLARRVGVHVRLLGSTPALARPHVQDPYGLSDSYVRTCLMAIRTAVDDWSRQVHPGVDPADGATARERDPVVHRDETLTAG